MNKRFLEMNVFNKFLFSILLKLFHIIEKHHDASKFLFYSTTVYVY